MLLFQAGPSNAGAPPLAAASCSVAPTHSLAARCLRDIVRDTMRGLHPLLFICAGPQHSCWGTCLFFQRS